MSNPAYKPPPPTLCSKAKVAKGGVYLQDSMVHVISFPGMGAHESLGMRLDHQVYDHGQSSIVLCPTCMCLLHSDKQSDEQS